LAIAAPDKKLVLAHYMPWYGTREVSGQWGWHWTMDHYDPERLKWDGQREAASHEYPMIGLYDSGDPAALECQVLQMKLAGIDGVIVDWYGTQDHLDYAVNHRNTQALVGYIKKAGLRFAICYEDQALKESEAVAQGKADLQWLKANWFADDAYVKVDGRPLLLVFGPQRLKLDQWNTIRAALPSKPMIHGLPHLAKETGMDGVYAWPPVVGGKTISRSSGARNWIGLMRTKVAG